MPSSDEIKVIRQGMAAATVRQLRRLLDEQSVNVPSVFRDDYLHASRALNHLAETIQQGHIPEDEWGFLTWLNGE